MRTLKFHSVNGAEVGPILVMLHGGYGSWMHWLNNIYELSKKFRIVVPDMPGFGESELLPYLPTLDQYAQILVDALDELLPDEQYNIVTSHLALPLDLI